MLMCTQESDMSTHTRMYPYLPSHTWVHMDDP